MFSLTDWFVVGLAFDVTGALLLAKGVLLSPTSIAQLSGTYWNYNPILAVQQVEDRTDAEVGIICLLVGFVLQGIGYTSGLFGTEAATGSSEAWTALGMAALGSAAALGLWRLLRKRRALKLLPRVALAQGNEDPPGQWTQTRAGLLLSCAVRLGHEQQDGEGKVAYARRVFKLELPRDCD